jgi:hypothetical protein
MSRLRSPSSGARVDLVTDPDPSASSIPSHITPGQVEGFAWWSGDSALPADWQSLAR